MFENIVTENEFNFNILEKKMFSFICELGCSILKTMLESLDTKIMNARDSKKFRHKGYKTNSIKTVLGLVQYKRVLYEYKDEHGKIQNIFLLDTILNISEVGKMSSNLVEKILSIAVETNSYRDAAAQIMETINLSISHEAVRNVVIKEGYKLLFKEQEEYNLMNKNKLTEGKKEIPVLFEEADGIWINLQGKDREKQINRYEKLCKKQGKEYIKPKSVKSELKLHVSYEGWKKDDKRHSLINKIYTTGFLSSKEIRHIRDCKIYQTYNTEKIEVRVMNGDGASWIDKMATSETIRQKDNFHIHQEIMRDITEDKHKRQIERLIAESRYNEIPYFIEFLRYECGGDEVTIKKLNKLESYLSSGLPRFREVLESQNRKLPEPPENIEYRDPGIMECQIFTVLSKRFKSGRMSFSKIGASCLAKICALKAENKGIIDTSKINVKVKEDLKKYKEEIEEKIEKTILDKATENAKNNEISTLTKYDEKITEIIDGTTRDMNAITFKQIVTMEWQLKGFSGYKDNTSSGVETIDISQYKFLKAPYAIINGTRALTAYVDDVTTTSLTLNWFAAWGSGLGSEFGMVRILLVEPN